jgi:hypothetical protein
VYHEVHVGTSVIRSVLILYECLVLHCRVRSTTADIDPCSILRSAVRAAVRILGTSSLHRQRVATSGTRTEREPLDVLRVHAADLNPQRSSL